VGEKNHEFWLIVAINWR